MDIRLLTTLDDFRRVVALEQEVWGLTGAEDVVTVPVLVASVRVGASLHGAFDEAGELVGFAYALPGWFDGRLVLWSHAAGVRAAVRRRGIGVALKNAQREYALSRGVDLMIWTYDPLMAQNAHFNVNRLGVVIHEYERDVYGTSASPLHAGAPTDRFVARWWLRDPRVEARLTAVRAGVTGPEPEPDGHHDMVAFEAAGAAASGPEPDALLVNDVAERGGWLVPSPARLDADAGRLRVRIPPEFDRMLRDAPDLALEWRLHAREVFETYFARGYRVVGFTRTADGGVYHLAARPAAT